MPVAGDDLLEIGRLVGGEDLFRDKGYTGVLLRPPEAAVPCSSWFLTDEKSAVRAEGWLRGEEAKATAIYLVRGVWLRPILLLIWRSYYMRYINEI